MTSDFNDSWLEYSCVNSRGRGRFTNDNAPAALSAPVAAGGEREDETTDSEALPDGPGVYSKEQLLALASTAPDAAPADLVSAAQQNSLSVVVIGKAQPPVNTLPLSATEQVRAGCVA